MIDFRAVVSMLLENEVAMDTVQKTVFLTQYISPFKPQQNHYLLVYLCSMTGNWKFPNIYWGMSQNVLKNDKMTIYLLKNRRIKLLLSSNPTDN